MISSLKDAIRRNDLREFTTLAGQLKEVPWEIENDLLIGRKQDFLKVLIDMETLSDFAKRHLMGLLDADNELLVKLKDD